jgi:hypothetical protein
MMRLWWAACTLMLAGQAFAAETARVVTAAEFYQQALTHKLRVTAGGLALEKAVLVEDDAPAVGVNNNPDAWDKVRGASVIRKELLVDAAAPAAPVLLLFWAEPGEGHPPLEVEVNGHALRYTAGGPKYESYFAMPLPAGLVRAGKNTIVFRSPESSQGWGFYIAQDSDYAKGSRTRTSAPGRSAKSNDGGAQWSTQLGQRDNLRGEYGVRLFFEQYSAEGTAVSPVLDLRTLAEPKTLVAPVEAGKLEIAATADVQAGSRLAISWRSGPTPFYQQDAWSDWNAVGGGLGGEAVPRGRFIQLRAQFFTADPAVSPRLSSLSLKSTCRDLPPHTADVALTEDRNQRIVESPIEFEYEPSDLAALQQFRKAFNLDGVVAGATSELAMLVKLRHWAAQMRNVTEGFPQRYPDWNAESIITRDASGMSITGFCLQYNLVLMQACRAFGMQGRHFCIDGYNEMGHEIAEIWSNQFQKWIYMDASLDANYSDPKTKVPSSLLELHRVYLGAFFRRAETIFSIDPGELAKRVTDTETRVPLKYSDGGYNFGKPVEDYPWWKEHGYLAAGKLRLTPRDNFLSSPAPLPLKQGAMWPGWDGFVNWEDARAPRMPVHANYVDKETDLYWTLNQARMVLLDGENAGELRVALKNSMPFFHHYLVRENGGEWKEQAGGFVWKLASGSNRLEVKPVDRSGLAGIISAVTLQRK